MMNSFEQTYKDLAIPHFREVFESIDTVMQTLGFPYYLIGATALALEFLKEGIKPTRGTKDIDFAVMISDLKDYERIVLELEFHGFKKLSAPWTLFSSQWDVVIDLLPFWEIEQNYTVNFHERFIDLHVLGFREVLADSVPYWIEEKIANIPPLPGMVILKLIAWSDRPEERGDDLIDVLKIIEHYYEMNQDEILEQHSDILELEPFDRRIISAQVLGRDARRFLKKSEAVSARVLGLLESNLSDPVVSAIARTWARKWDVEIEYSYAVLKAFQRGLLQSS